MSETKRLTPAGRVANTSGSGARHGAVGDGEAPAATEGTPGPGSTSGVFCRICGCVYLGKDRYEALDLDLWRHEMKGEL